MAGLAVVLIGLAIIFVIAMLVFMLIVVPTAIWFFITGLFAGGWGIALAILAIVVYIVAVTGSAVSD